MTTAEKHHLIATVIDGFDYRVCTCFWCVATGHKVLCFFDKDGYDYRYDDLNYSTDLNLCARAENKITDYFAKRAYLDELEEAVGFDAQYYEVDLEDTFLLVLAPAEARVRALVKAAEWIVRQRLRESPPQWTLTDHKINWPDVPEEK